MSVSARRESNVDAPPKLKAVDVQDRPRDAEFAWLRAHALEYDGQWVALDGDRLLGASLVLDEILEKITPEERERALFHRVVVE
jgi:hypothetical protein